MADYTFTAGDTEPITYTVTITSASELSTSDVQSMVLYARERGGSTNHVDGASVTVDSVSTSQASDGTWTNDFSVTFDPENNGPGGANAFDTGDEGIYLIYTLVTWTDSDTSRHPASDKREWKVVPNYE